MIQFTLKEYYETNHRPPGIECYHLYVIGCQFHEYCPIYIGSSYAHRCKSGGILNRLGKKLKLSRKEPTSPGDWYVRYLVSQLHEDTFHKFNIVVLNPDEIAFFGLTDYNFSCNSEGNFSPGQVAMAEEKLIEELCPIFNIRPRCPKSRDVPIYIQAKMGKNLPKHLG